MKTRRKKPELKVFDVKELEDIIERAAGVLSEEDAEKLRDLLESMDFLQQELADKSVSLARLRALFGLNQSEKTDKVLGKDATLPDGDKAEKKPKKKEKRKGHGRRSAQEYEGARQVHVPHDSLGRGDPCPECPKGKQGKLYRALPRTLIRVIGQAPLQATVYSMQGWRCNLCGKVFHARPPQGVGDKKYDATSASMIALLKYGSGLPFNRLERLERNLGIPLPAATQWEIVEEAAKELQPVYQELIRQAAQGHLLHNDDTSMRVLDLRKEIDALERDGKKDRTGIFSTGIVSEITEGRRIALYITGRQHAGENMADLLTQRAAELDQPLQMCDGLDRNLPKDFETVIGNCLAHARRKFVEVVSSFPDECRHVLETLREVYANDAVARQRELEDDERLRYHQEHSKPLMDALQEWMKQQTQDKRVEPHSSLGKAMAYMTNRWDRLTLFLREPGAPLDNNLVERALKRAILHRKNSLFYKTENGARVGDLFMGLIHTAELAKVNPFEYLTALLQHVDQVKDQPDRWLPWNYADSSQQEPAAADSAAS